MIERRLPDGRVVYDIGYRVAGRLVKRKGGSTAEEAEAALTVALAEIATGTIRAHSTDTLGSYSARWLERRKPFVSDGTWQDYQYAVALRIAPTLGAIKLRDVTRSVIEDAATEWQKQRPRGRRRGCGYSAKTINNTLSVLSNILGTAVADGLIRDNPTRWQGGATGPLRSGRTNVDLPEKHRLGSGLMVLQGARTMIVAAPAHSGLSRGLRERCARRRAEPAKGSASRQIRG